MADPVRDFAMTPTGGWAVVNGDFATVAGKQAIPQGIQIRVNTQRKEIWIDPTKGLPWIDEILVKSPDGNVVRALLSLAILDTPDVTDVRGAQLVGPDANRQGFMNFVVTSIYSTETIEGQTIIPTLPIQGG